jgi:tRNA-dihydrouridine synthase A
MIHFSALEEDDQKRDFNLRFHPCEQPVVCQLGGSEPSALQKSATYVRKYGYSEVNLNSGCPSSKVQKGCFGAILMKQDNRDLLVDIVDSMWKGWNSEEL